MSLIDTPSHPAPKVRSMPVAPYVSEEFYRQEQEKIFRKCWLNIGSANQIPKPGDYFVYDLKVLDMSILVVRGRDKKVRAFHNVCMHRNNLLSHKACGNARAFTCIVHGWTFDLQGNLAHVPPELGLADLDKSTRGLVELQLDTWHGFVFIHPDPKNAVSLKEYLGEVWPVSDGHPLETWDRIGHYSMDAESNWKTFLLSFIETAHVKTIHSKTVEDYAAEVIQPDLNAVGRHCEMRLYVNLHHEPYPVESFAIEASPGFMMHSGRQNHAALNPKKQQNWAFDQYTIFPNCVIFFGDGWCTTQIVYPDGVNKSYWEGSYYSAPATSPTHAMANHYFGVKMRDTVREDLDAVEAMQRGMRSGATDDIVLADGEQLIAHHHAVSMEYIEGRA